MLYTASLPNFSSTNPPPPKSLFSSLVFAKTIPATSWTIPSLQKGTMTNPSSPAAATATDAAPTAAEITTNYPQSTVGLQRIAHRTRPGPLTIEPPNPLWPTHYERLRDRIQSALGSGSGAAVLLTISHVGSTSVPGLPAKPIIDIDVVVADPTDEGSYVAALVGEGWKDTGTGRGSGAEEDGGGGGGGGAGLQFLFREPAWHEHRFFVRDDKDGEPWANVHVFGPGCPEVVRHRIFREWLLEVSESIDIASTHVLVQSLPSLSLCVFHFHLFSFFVLPRFSPCC